MTVSVSVNGFLAERTVDARRLLEDFLREDVGLTAPISAVSMEFAGQARSWWTATR